MGFAGSVKVLSGSTAQNRLNALAPMKDLRGKVESLAALAAAPDAARAPYASALANAASGILDATANGAIERALGANAQETAQGRMDALQNSLGEFDDWIKGAQAFADGPESAGFLAEIAASDLGSSVIAAGLYTDAMLGIQPPPSTSGRDDQDIKTAADRAARTKKILTIGIGVGGAVVIVAIAAYAYHTFG